MTEINTANTANTATIIARHALSVQLTEPADGYIIQTVSGKKETYDGFRAIVPEITWAQVELLAETDARIRRFVINSLEASQRQLMRQIERNGQSLTTENTNLDAIVAFEASSGVAAVRVTKELIADMAPLFRKAVAAMFAEAKGIADKMAESEIFAASAATQNFYLSQIDALRGSAIPTLEVLRGTKKVMDLTKELATGDASVGDKVRYAIAAAGVKLDAAIAEAEKTGDLVQMF